MRLPPLSVVLAAALLLLPCNLLAGKNRPIHTRPTSTVRCESVSFYAADSDSKPMSKAAARANAVAQKIGVRGCGYKVGLEETSGNGVSIEIRPNSASIKCSPHNAGLAVGEFMKRAFGTKIFAPSTIGFETDFGKRMRVGTTEIRPSFEGRNFGTYQSESADYDFFNGANTAFTMPSHILPEIFRNASDENPEWFALVDGKRADPKRNPQPHIDFLNGGAQRYAAKKSLEFFKKNPEAKIFSLSCADSPSFDESEHTQRAQRGFNGSGYADFSNAAFSLSNFVAKGLEKSNPDKFVGDLAYLRTENPPDFRMSPNALVYLCTDRSNYFDKSERKRDLELIEKWARSGVGKLGIYDYNYGKQYFIPRNTAAFIADSISSASKSGVTLYNCESYPLWAYDAHKMWVMSNMLKDSSADFRSLEREFFDAYYKNASADVRGFFDVAERAWTRRTDAPLWLKLLKRESQAELFSEDDIREMETFLSRAEKAANAGVMGKRIFELRLVFDITKAFSDSYRLQKKLFARIDARDDSAKILDTLEASRIAKIRKRLAVERQSENTKYPPADFGIWKSTSFIDAEEKAAVHLLKYADDATRARVRELFGDDFVKLADDLLFAKNILKNSSFKNGTDHWKIYRTRTSTEKIAADAKEGIELSARDFVGLSQSADVEAQRAYEGSAKIAGEIKIGEVCYLRLSFFDADGKLLLSKRSQLPCGKFDGTTLSVFSRAPKNSTYATLSLFAGNMHPSNSIFVREIRLEESLAKK